MIYKKQNKIYLKYNIKTNNIILSYKELINPYKKIKIKLSN